MTTRQQIRELITIGDKTDALRKTHPTVGSDEMKEIQKLNTQFTQHLEVLKRKHPAKYRKLCDVIINMFIATRKA